ncbi:hypothetical protein [Brevibacillus antibioticus]|nr:hypothetical protein [Brevibacillus antibioticus]
MENGKLFGIGLKQAILLSLFMIVMFVLWKTLFTKYPVKGVTEIVQAA